MPGINIMTKGQRERLQVTVVFHAAGRVKPNEGRGLGVNDIAIRTINII